MTMRSKDARGVMSGTSMMASTGALLAAATSFAFAAPANAQVSIGLTNIGAPNAVCINSDVAGSLGVSTEQDCDASFTAAPYLQIGPAGSNVNFNASTGTATFNATANFNDPANFNNNVQMSGLQAFSGTSTFNSTVSFVGPSVTFSTGTTFANPATFNGTTDFNAAMTTTSIVNSGAISTNTLSSTGISNTFFTGGFMTLGNSLTVASGALIDFGGNRVRNVGAGVAATDAVNVGQLNAATAGISADVTALETTTAIHTTQIADIQAVNTTQSNQISAVQAVNTTQSNQISAIQAVNTTQSGQISALEAASLSMAESIDTLFDLRTSDRRDMKQGIASAIAIAPAPMPSAPGKVSYAFNGATFRGEYAAGGSLMYRLPGDTPVAVNVGFSYAGNKNNGVRVGVAGEF